MLNTPVLHHTSTMPSAVKAVWQTLDLTTFNAVRVLYVGPYPQLKSKMPVKDSKERDMRAWNMREQISGIWSRTARSIYDTIWEIPVIDRLYEAVAIAIVTAREYGAITASWNDMLLAHNRSCHSVIDHIPQIWIHYVDGKRYECWDDAKLHLGDNLINNPAMVSRHEWKARPGHPVSARITPLPQEAAKPLTGRFDRWVPVCEPKAMVDIDRNFAIDAITKAFFRLGQW